MAGFNSPGSPSDQDPPPMEEMSAVGKAAIERDKAWFRANPNRTRLERSVRRKELPRGLRKLGAARVLIERVDGQRFVRTWFDRHGRPLASGFDEYNDVIVPSTADGTIVFQHRGSSVRCLVDHGTAADDRRWFEAHPCETLRTRPMTDEEMLSVPTPPGCVCTGGKVTVRKISDGSRTRELNYLVALAESVQ